MTDWHERKVSESLHQLDSKVDSGLAEDQVQARRAHYGPNELVETAGRGPWRILWEQLSGAMVVLLIVAACVSAFLHEYTDTAVILVIVVLNAALGFVQDYRAERALAALKKLAVPIVRVRRDGVLREMSARELVPGDIVLLEVGNYVPADCRLWESVNLRIEEAALTGESEPVEKQVEALAGHDLPLGDRTNMAYNGHGRDVWPRTGCRDGNRDEHRAGTHRSVAANCRGRTNAAAEPPRPTWPHTRFRRDWDCRVGVYDGPGAGRRLEVDVDDGTQPSCRCCARRLAGGGNGYTGDGGAADVQAAGLDSQAACRRNARLGHGDLLGQDRHADREPHDGHGARRGR